MKIGTGLLDKMVNGAFLGKRKMGRPIKYNIRTRGRDGWIELVFNPQNAFEQRASDFVRFMHPYLAFITYRFHVEKAREIGIRIEDFYHNKFHKEPYYMHHVYAQYFHPSTLLERVRDVSFYRRPRTIFKGFKVPDWATAERMNGWEVDSYSRRAWEEALHELHSESTPAPFFGSRQEPNPLQWFRLEQFGKGMSSRLYFNEVPEPWWNRHQGHMDPNQKEELLYSFTNGDQRQAINFGIDTTTEEGRAQFKAEYDAICQIAPELLRPENMLFPHEMPKRVTTEAHFQRVWSYYREFSLRNAISNAVNNGSLSQSDADSALSFLGRRNSLSVSQYVLAQQGLRPDLANDSGYQAASRAFSAIGLQLNINNLTAEPFENQFWRTFDTQLGLTEVDMREKLPQFISDPSSRSQVQALMEEKTQQLTA